jgi:hypothetical protein
MVTIGSEIWIEIGVYSSVSHGDDGGSACGEILVTECDRSVVLCCVSRMLVTNVGEDVYELNRETVV